MIILAFFIWPWIVDIYFKIYMCIYVYTYIYIQQCIYMHTQSCMHIYMHTQVIFNDCIYSILWLCPNLMNQFSTPGHQFLASILSLYILVWLTFKINCWIYQYHSFHIFFIFSCTFLKVNISYPSITSFASNVKDPADEEEKSQLWWTFPPTPEGDP